MRFRTQKAIVEGGRKSQKVRNIYGQLLLRQERIGGKKEWAKSFDLTHSNWRGFEPLTLRLVNARSIHRAARA